MDTVLIQDLEVRCVIGVHAWERRVRQRLLLDLELDVDVTGAAREDDLAQTIDYAAVCSQVSELAQAGEFRLIETLAVRAAEALLETTVASRVTVTVHKPGAVRQAARVGVRVTRP